MTVLAYHGIGADCGSSRVVCVRRFRSHAAFLRRSGYTGLTLSAAEERRTAGSLPNKCVVITFDDGFASVLRTVPILEWVGFPATVFVVTRAIDSGAILSWPFVEQVASDDPSDMRPLSWPELRQLADRGWEIGSHTITHPYLGALSDDALQQELSTSRDRIRAEIGTCESLAYPYGIADNRVIRAAQRAGYRTACTLAPVYDRDERLARSRIGIGPRDGRLRFRLKVSPRATALRQTRVAQVVQVMRERVSGRRLPDHRQLLGEWRAAQDPRRTARDEVDPVAEGPTFARE